MAITILLMAPIGRLIDPERNSIEIEVWEGEITNTFEVLLKYFFYLQQQAFAMQAGLFFTYFRLFFEMFSRRNPTVEVGDATSLTL